MAVFEAGLRLQVEIRGRGTLQGKGKEVAIWGLGKGKAAGVSKVSCLWGQLGPEEEGLLSPTGHLGGPSVVIDMAVCVCVCVF